MAVLNHDGDNGEGGEVAEDEDNGRCCGGAQRIVVGQLVAHEALGRKPTHVQAGAEGYQGQHILVGYHVEVIEHRVPEDLNPFQLAEGQRAYCRQYAHRPENYPYRGVARLVEAVLHKAHHHLAKRDCGCERGHKQQQEE